MRLDVQSPLLRRCERVRRPVWLWRRVRLRCALWQSSINSGPNLGLLRRGRSEALPLHGSERRVLPSRVRQLFSALVARRFKRMWQLLRQNGLLLRVRVRMRDGRRM